MKAQTVGVALAVLTAVGLAYAGSHGIGTGGLSGPMGGAAIGSGSTLGPGCVVTATGITCVGVDAGNMNVYDDLAVGDRVTLGGQFQCRGANCVIDWGSAGTSFLTAGVSGTEFTFSSADIAFNGSALTRSSSTDVLTNSAQDLSTGSLYRINNRITTDATAITIATGCTGESVTWSTGTSSFQVDVGGTCTGVTTMTITFANATTNAWSCSCDNLTTIGANIKCLSGSTTTRVCTNVSDTLGTALDWVDGTDVLCQCKGG